MTTLLAVILQQKHYCLTMLHTKFAYVKYYYLQAGYIRASFFIRNLKSYDKFYLLVCMRNFDIFFYDKYTYSKAIARMLAFEKMQFQSKNWQSRNFVRLYGSTMKVI